MEWEVLCTTALTTSINPYQWIFKYCSQSERHRFNPKDMCIHIDASLKNWNWNNSTTSGSFYFNHEQNSELI